MLRGRIGVGNGEKPVKKCVSLSDKQSERSDAYGQWSKGQGYMYRRVTRYIKMNAKHVRPADVEQVVDSSEDESGGEENSDLEEGEDESSRLIRPPGIQSHRMTSMQADGTSRRNERQSRRAKNQETGSREIGASQRDNVEQRDSDSEEEVHGGGHGEVKKITVEHHIVHSKTYHCPQLLLRAWNEGESDFPSLPLLSPRSTVFWLLASGFSTAITDPIRRCQ